MYSFNFIKIYFLMFKRDIKIFMTIQLKSFIVKEKKVYSYFKKCC